MNKFAQKMINSGHGIMSTKITLVQGATKYLENVYLNNLPKDHARFRPMFLYKEFKEEERQVQKNMAKVAWFSNRPSSRVKREWREYLKGI